MTNFVTKTRVYRDMIIAVADNGNGYVILDPARIMPNGACDIVDAKMIQNQA